MQGGDPQDNGAEPTEQGGNDNGDPRNPPNPTPGALKPIDPNRLPSSKDLGGS